MFTNILIAFNSNFCFFFYLLKNYICPLNLNIELYFYRNIKNLFNKYIRLFFFPYSKQNIIILYNINLK